MTAPKLQPSLLEQPLTAEMKLIETNPEVKSFIYQQIAELNPFVTPETVVMVIAKDPKDIKEESFTEDIDVEELRTYKHRIAIVLKEHDTSIEAEAYHDDIYEAIKLAKDSLLNRLIEIQEEVESPSERLEAIKLASANQQIH